MSFRRTLCALTATAMIGLNSFFAFPYSQNVKHDLNNMAFAFGDIDGDGLTDMIVANDSSVSYFRNVGNSQYQKKQTIYTSKDKKKANIFLLTIKGEPQLTIITSSEFRTYKLNNRGMFEEHEFEPEWQYDDPEEEPKPIKDVV